MARKQHGGQAPTAIAGLSAQNTTLSAAVDEDIIIDPQGTGVFRISGNQQIDATGDLRFADADSTNWVAFEAPNTVSSNVTWTLPSADATAADQSLISDGAGTLSWATTGAALTDNNSDLNTNYILFTDSNTGTLTQARVSSSDITFVPNTGTLTVKALTESSSIALKENLNPISNALDSIISLQAYTYDRKDGTSKSEPGLIAEEVAKIIPNLVMHDQDNNPSSIRYTKVVAYLVEAVKELKQELENYKMLNNSKEI